MIIHKQLQLYFIGEGTICICKRPDGSTDVKGHWNHVSLKQSMARVPIEVARQEVWDIVSRSLGLIVFGGTLHSRKESVRWANSKMVQ